VFLHVTKPFALPSQFPPFFPLILKGEILVHINQVMSTAEGYADITVVSWKYE
jgi:hypothetical protein